MNRDLGVRFLDCDKSGKNSVALVVWPADEFVSSTGCESLYGISFRFVIEDDHFRGREFRSATEVDHFRGREFRFGEVDRRFSELLKHRIDRLNAARRTCDRVARVGEVCVHIVGRAHLNDGYAHGSPDWKQAAAARSGSPVG